MKLSSLFIIGLLVGSVSAFELNLTGSMSSPYPLLFVDCEGDCSQYNVTYGWGNASMPNHVALFSQVSGRDMLFLELSGMTESRSFIVNVVRQPTVYRSFSLNEPYVDYLSSMTVSISDILAVGTVVGDNVFLSSDTSSRDVIVNVEQPEEEFRFPTVGEILESIGVRL